MGDKLAIGRRRDQGLRAQLAAWSLPTGRARPFGRVGAVAFAVCLAWPQAGCTIVDEFVGEEPTPQTISVSEDEIDDSTTPNLSRVPAEPPEVMPLAERQLLTESLEADRAAATFLSSAPEESTQSRPRQASTAAAPELAPKLKKPAPLLQPQWNGAPITGRVGPAGQEELGAVVFFTGGSTSLDATDRTALRDLVILWRERGGSLRIVGHGELPAGTGPVAGRNIANLELSLSRADQVAGELRRLEVPQSRLLVEGRAASEPSQGTYLPPGEPGDQRVEIFFTFGRVASIVDVAAPLPSGISSEPPPTPEDLP